MKSKVFMILMTFGLIFILSCNKDETPVSSANNVSTAPQNLVATPGNLLATLNWQAPSNIGSSAITGYNIYRGLTSGGQTFIKTIAGTNLSFVDSNLTNGTKYYYYVTALNNTGESNRSNEAFAIPRPNPTPPSVPTNVSLSSPGNNNVTINWNPPLDNGGAFILGYKIYKGTNSSNLTLLTTIDTISPRSYVDYAVVINNTYFYSMTAFNNVGEGARTTTESFTVGAGVIKGNIKDSISGANLENVIITTLPATTTVQTNSSGDFIIPGVINGTYNITAKKFGYYTRSWTAILSNSDTVISNTKMMFTGLYVYNGLTVQQANTSHTNLSAVNLYNGIVINEFVINDPNKDIQMRNSFDSLGMGYNFYLRSGDLAFLRAGSKTFFGAPLTNPKTGQPSFTKTEFDTLSSIYNYSGNLNTYFTQNATATFNYFPEGSNAVYPFYLAGRSAVTPGVIGVIYLRNSYIGVGNLFYLNIDVKVNRKGLNIFN